jgi:disulfide bond formation protein DsbB
MKVESSGQFPLTEQTSWIVIFVCWLLATIATLGSLFFSEVMEIQPCVLCWYQRIFMYPLVVIFLVGLFPLDRNVVRYALPIAVIGWGISVYHYLLYSGYIPENMQPCSQGVSCTEINLELLGFITIPMLSILSNSAIIALLLVFKKRTIS